jgi:hypothetical protein
MSIQQDRILNVLQSPSNSESTVEGTGKATKDIETIDVGDL